MFLTVENYNSIENVQKRNLPNRFLESFQPDFYERTGFPSRIVSNKEIYRFLDSMHDGRLKWYYEEHNFAPIQEEFEIIKEVAQNIYSFSEGEYNKGIVVKAPMLSSMNIFRKLRYLSISEELPTIFEIGGGCGILGVLLHKAGYKYISTDVTQAFYLTQNNLWEGLFPGCVRECLESIENLDEIGAEEIVHVPYWEMWDLRNADLEADIMVANHCLTEMAENSLRFYLQYGKRLMRNSKYKLLIAQNPGSLRFRSLEYLIKTFDIMGYALLYSYGDYLVFCLKDKEGIIPANMKKVLKAIRHRSTEIPKYENALDQTARLIISGKQKIQDMPKVSLKEIEEFFRSIDKKIDSPDEEFVHYIGYQII